MTREDIRKQAEVMMAYADGKAIQLLNYDDRSWIDIDNPLFDWATYTYRVKPEPSYVPYKTVYEFVEALTVHSGSTDIILKRGSLTYYVMSIDFNSDSLLVGMRMHNGSFRYHMQDMLDFTFTDGTTCGHAIIPEDL